VIAVDPMQTMASQDAALAGIAEQVRGKLARVVAAL